MKKVFLVFLVIVVILSLNSCATYYANFPAPNEKVNPYDQKPLPKDGAANLLKDIITK